MAASASLGVVTRFWARPRPPPCARRQWPRRWLRFRIAGSGSAWRNVRHRRDSWHRVRRGPGGAAPALLGSCADSRCRSWPALLQVRGVLAAEMNNFRRDGTVILGIIWRMTNEIGKIGAFFLPILILYQSNPIERIIAASKGRRP